MPIARPAFAPHPGAFGRGQIRQLSEPRIAQAWAIGSDAKLFATTFLAGFVFVSMLIA